MIGPVGETNHGFVASRFGVYALRIFVRQSTEDFKFSLSQTVALGMGVAHHHPDPLGFERSAHVLFHVIEDLPQSPFKIGLEVFDVRTVAHKILCHGCLLLSVERRTPVNIFACGATVYWTLVRV